MLVNTSLFSLRCERIPKYLSRLSIIFPNPNPKWHNGKSRRHNNLHQIKEEDEDIIIIEDGSSNQPLDLTEDIDDNIFVTQDEVAQAFSHFTYVHSAKKLLICDLQGVYDSQNKLFRFTDPVIHYHDVKKQKVRGHYGRTDVSAFKNIWHTVPWHECCPTSYFIILFCSLSSLSDQMGQKGITNFLKSHRCNCLCDLVTRGFVTPSTSKIAST